MEQGHDRSIREVIRSGRARGDEFFLPKGTLNEFLEESRADPTRRERRLQILADLDLVGGPDTPVAPRISVRFANLIQRLLTEDYNVLEEAEQAGKKRKGADILIAAEVVAGEGELWTHDRRAYFESKGDQLVPKERITRSIENGGLGMTIAGESFQTYPGPK